MSRPESLMDRLARIQAPPPRPDIDEPTDTAPAPALVPQHPLRGLPVKRLPWVCEQTGLHQSTIYRLERAGKFPKRVVLGPNSVGWHQAEVEDWIANRPRRVSL